MKKTICRLLIVLMLFSAFTLCFTACTEKTYTVTMMAYIKNPEFSLSISQQNKKVYGVYETRKVSDGSIIGDVEIEDTVIVDGVTYRFSGWFTDKSYGIQWNLMSDTVKGDMTLYSKWETV